MVRAASYGAILILTALASVAQGDPTLLNVQPEVVARDLARIEADARMNRPPSVPLNEVLPSGLQRAAYHCLRFTGALTGRKPFAMVVEFSRTGADLEQHIFQVGEGERRVSRILWAKPKGNSRAEIDGVFNYVITTDGKIRFGQAFINTEEEHKHANLVGGRVLLGDGPLPPGIQFTEPIQVRGAGQVIIRKGKIHRVNRSSGHFAPKPEHAPQIEAAFRELDPLLFSNYGNFRVEGMESFTK